MKKTIFLRLPKGQFGRDKVEKEIDEFSNARLLTTRSTKDGIVFSVEITNRNFLMSFLRNIDRLKLGVEKISEK